MVQTRWPGKSQTPGQLLCFERRTGNLQQGMFHSTPPGKGKLPLHSPKTNNKYHCSTKSLSFCTWLEFHKNPISLRTQWIKPPQPLPSHCIKNRLEWKSSHKQSHFLQNPTEEFIEEGRKKRKKMSGHRFDTNCRLKAVSKWLDLLEPIASNKYFFLFLAQQLEMVLNKYDSAPCP